MGETWACCEFYRCSIANPDYELAPGKSLFRGRYSSRPSSRYIERLALFRYVSPAISTTCSRLKSSNLTVPEGVVHYVIWSRRPFTHNETVAPPVRARVEQDGLWGFTGGEDRLKSDDPHAELMRLAAAEIQTFISTSWDVRFWETAWFMNPPVGVLIFLFTGHP